MTHEDRRHIYTASPAMAVCPKCGTRNPISHNYCNRGCGTPLDPRKQLKKYLAEFRSSSRPKYPVAAGLQAERAEETS